MHAKVDKIALLPNKPYASEDEHKEWKLCAQIWNRMMTETEEKSAAGFTYEIRQSLETGRSVLWGPNVFPKFIVSVLWPEPAFAIFEPDVVDKKHTFPNTDIDDDDLVVYEVPLWGHFIIGRKLWNDSLFPRAKKEDDRLTIRLSRSHAFRWRMSKIFNSNDWESLLQQQKNLKQNDRYLRFE